MLLFFPGDIGYKAGISHQNQPVQSCWCVDVATTQYVLCWWIIEYSLTLFLFFMTFVIIYFRQIRVKSFKDFSCFHFFNYAQSAERCQNLHAKTLTKKTVMILVWYWTSSPYMSRVFKNNIDVMHKKMKGRKCTTFYSTFLKRFSVLFLRIFGDSNSSGLI